MKQGAYLKKSATTPKKRQAGRISNDDHNAAGGEKIMKKRKKMKSISRTLCVVCLLFIIGMIVFFTYNRNPLIGKWNMDGVTTYEFYFNGKGAMVLPTTQYEFAYDVEDDNLYIDFDYEGAKDAEYTFNVAGDQLHLEGGNATTQGTFVLSKIE